MKIVRQHDLKDCGAACLASILRYHGRKMAISKVRDNVKTDTKGTTILGLVEGAKALGFSAKAVKGSIDSLTKEIPLPAVVIVHLENNLEHSMVLYNVSKKTVSLMDPAKGKVRMTKEKFARIWTGYIVFVQPTTEFKKGNEVKGTFTRFFSLILNQKSLVLTVFLMSLVLTMLGIVTSFYFKFIMDEIIPNGLQTSLNTLSLAFLLLYIVRALLTFFRGHVLLYMSRRIDVSLILGYYNHVVDLPMDFYSKRKVGEIISRFSDASSIKRAISGVTLTIMLDTLLIVGGGFILYLINDELFLITLAIVVLYILITIYFVKPFKKKNSEVMESNAKVTSYLVESLQGSETIKTFNAVEDVKNETEKKYIEALDTGFNYGVLSNSQVSLKGVVQAVGGLVILWHGVTLVLNNTISVGQLLTFNALLAYFLGPIRNVIDLQAGLQTAFVSADRLSEIIDLDVEDKSGTIVIEEVERIEMSEVSFRYGARKKVLSDVSLTIAKGETVAIVGETGSGKTTIVKLILSLFELEEGKIEINGHDLKDICKESLRNSVSYIPQDIFMFSGSVYDNLTLGNETPMEEVIEVCKKYKADEFISDIPGRYEGVIEERGVNLSGGQLQKLAIVRAILRNPSVLIMDEATSNLDAIMEQTLVDLISETSMTKIIIAHRLSTIKNADKIVVLDQGRIIEVGSHNQLLEKKNHYYQLWNRYLGERV